MQDASRPKQVLARLAEYILERKDQIIDRWSQEVYQNSEIKSSDNLTYHQLVQHLPKLLEEIYELLINTANSKSKTDTMKVANIHGQHRWQQGYDLDELLREFGVLRIVMSEFITTFQVQNRDFTPDVELEARRILTELINEVSISSTLQFAKENEVAAHTYRDELEAANRKLAAANEELQRANERLNKLSKSRQMLTRTATHDMRNILSAISGAVRILTKADNNPEMKQEMMSMLQRNISDMESLIDQLLDYSLLIADQEKLNIEKIDLTLLIVELVTAFKPIAEAKGLKLECDVDTTLSNISSDRLKIKRIVTNLLSNAIKYTPEGEVRLRLESRSPEHLAIVVEDTGAGIEPDSLPLIFEEFHRGAASAGIRGTGLGLAITKRLVEMLRGEIAVRSEVGKGSRFEVTLPKNF